MTVTNTRKKHKKISLLEDVYLAQTAVLDGQLLKLGGTEGTVVPATANDRCIGVSCNAVTAAQITQFEADGTDRDAIEVIVMEHGIAPVLAGGQVAAGAYVVSDANGRIVTYTGDGTDEIIGQCLDAATGNGEATHIQIIKIPVTTAA